MIRWGKEEVWSDQRTGKMGIEEGEELRLVKLASRVVLRSFDYSLTDF